MQHGTPDAVLRSRITRGWASSEPDGTRGREVDRQYTVVTHRRLIPFEWSGVSTVASKPSRSALLADLKRYQRIHTNPLLINDFGFSLYSAIHFWLPLSRATAKGYKRILRFSSSFIRFSLYAFHFIFTSVYLFVSAVMKHIRWPTIEYTGDSRYTKYCTQHSFTCRNTRSLLYSHFPIYNHVLLCTYSTKLHGIPDFRKGTHCTYEYSLSTATFFVGILHALWFLSFY